MLKSVKNFIFRLLYALPFGFKGADSEIFGKKDTSNGQKLSIQQKTSQKNLGEALLQAEVTQEVEELRYQTYKVAKEAQNYEYLGEGVALKRENKESEEFILNNHVICEGIEHELNRLNDYSIDRYLLNVRYKDISRFKLEKFCNKFKVNLKNKEISLFFEKNTNVPERRMLYNEFEKMLNSQKSELQEYPIYFSFVNEQHLIKYELFDAYFDTITNEQYEYIITYKFKDFKTDDYVKRFYSKTMDEKYKNKERKTDTVSISPQERKRYCSSCGNEMSIFDGDITEQSFGYPLCQDCIKKMQEKLKDK